MITRNRNAVKVCVFIGIFVVLFVLMMFVFSYHPDHRIYQMIGGFYDEKEDGLHGVYIGSSDCYAFFNPIFAWKESGMAIRTYSCGSMPFSAIELIVREARKTQPDALYIINTNSVERDDLDAETIHGLISYMPGSEIREQLIEKLSDQLGYSAVDKLEFRFPWIRIREFWGNIILNGLRPQDDGVKGASHYSTYLNKETNISDIYMTCESCEELPDYLIESANNLLDYLEKENVKVLFVNVPRAEIDEGTMGRINSMNDLIENRGFSVLRLQEQWDDIGLSLSNDYYNRKHTNIHGAIKFTSYLTDYIQANYDISGLPVTVDEESWNQAAETYAAMVKTYVPDFELDVKARDYSLEAPMNLTAIREEKDGAQGYLQWEAVSGAEGYIIYRKTGNDGAWERVSDMQSETRFSIFGIQKGSRYFYTVVPVYEENGKMFYGNFSYKGIRVEL